MSVLTTVETVTLLAQLNVSNVAQAQHFAVGGGADDYLTELLWGLQTPFVLHSVLVRLGGVLADGTCSRFDILLGESRRYITRHQAVLRHHIGAHPDTHRVVAAQHHHLPDTLNTQQFGFDVDVDIVAEEGLVVGVVGRRHGEYLQHTRLPLECLHTYHLDLGRQLRRSRRNLVLYIHRSHIGVGALLEIDIYLRRTGVGCRGGHIGHILDTVDCLFERGDDGFLYRLGTGTIVLGHHHNGRWCDVGVLFDRERLQSDDTQQRNHNRYHCRQHRPLHKSLYVHILFLLFYGILFDLFGLSAPFVLFVLFVQLG